MLQLYHSFLLYLTPFSISNSFNMNPRVWQHRPGHKKEKKNSFNTCASVCVSYDEEKKKQRCIFLMCCCCVCVYACTCVCAASFINGAASLNQFLFRRGRHAGHRADTHTPSHVLDDAGSILPSSPSLTPTLQTF